MKSLALLLVLLAARPGWLGLGFTHHTQDREQWVVVRAVAPGGPAEKAGLQQGDVITTINDKRIDAKDTVALLEKLGTIRAGEKVRLGIVRGEKKLTVVLVPAPMTDEQFERWKANLELERHR